MHSKMWLLVLINDFDVFLKAHCDAGNLCDTFFVQLSWTLSVNFGI